MRSPGGFLHLFFEGQSVLIAILGWHSFPSSPPPYFTRKKADILAGYFVLNHATLASSQSLFAQLWKEYSLSDSRYLTSDPFMLCIETVSYTHLTLPTICSV